MTDQTALDNSHAAMEAAPEAAAARMQFYASLADAELLLLLEEEPTGDHLSPQVFQVEEGQFILAFDTEERLAAFAEATVPYAALSGRVLAGMLQGQGIGLGVNLGVAPSSILLPPEAIGWLVDTVAQTPDQTEARIEAIQPPTGLPQILQDALGAKLANAGGLAQAACLVAVTYQGGGRGHLLAFIGAAEQAQPALAKAAGEALTFSGLEAGALDVGFFDPDDTVVAQFLRTGLSFDLPEPVRPDPSHPSAPGMDPERPPKLR